MGCVSSRYGLYEYLREQDAVGLKAHIEWLTTNRVFAFGGLDLEVSLSLILQYKSQLHKSEKGLEQAIAILKSCHL